MELTNFAKIEGLLFVKGEKGVSMNEFKKVLKVDAEIIRQDINKLNSLYMQNNNSALNIKCYKNIFYLLTKENLKKFIVSNLNAKIISLPTNCMEVLSIIAYNNPCSTSKIEKIIGKKCNNIIKKLEDLNLIKFKDKDKTPGCPNIYELTTIFFNKFGIKNLSKLPDINSEINTDGDIFLDNCTDE
jgi:segregation and condensation protein B